MKISNSKKQLAKIISENGGWRDDAKFAAQDYGGDVFFYETKPTRLAGVWRHQGVLGGDWINCDKAQPNWHQTVLARDEYFHLYPSPDAVVVENKTTRHLYVTDKPTIEQLAADYRNKLAIARQAQEEADSHRCGAEAALKLLELAGVELGLVIGVCETTKQGADLDITDWRDLKVGDIIECIGRWENEDTDGRHFAVTELEPEYYNGCLPIRIEVPGVPTPGTWGGDFKFICRP